MKTAFVNPFSRRSEAEQAYRETGTHEIEHFVPAYIFDTVEEVHARHRRNAEDAGRTYEPVIVAEVEVLDRAEHPSPNGRTDTVPLRVIRLVE